MVSATSCNRGVSQVAPRPIACVAELQALADRWAVVELLRENRPYREIHRLTGVSVTTIGRVARYLLGGNGGYALAVARTGEARHG